MALRFQKLTQSNLRALQPNKTVNEHGISATRLANGDLRWKIGTMVDGTRIHRVIGKESEGVTRTQAEQVIEKLRTDARDNRLSLPKARKNVVSFAQCADDYIAGLTLEDGKGIARKTQHVEARLKPHFGKLRIDSVTETSVLEFIKLRKDSGAKPSTINRELATLSHLFRCACRWKWVTLDKVPHINRQKEGQGRIIALSPDQCRALLNAALDDQDDDLWLFILICLLTSMRHGEARRIKWEHFDEHRRCFFIPEAKAGERHQPLPDDLCSKLIEERERRGVAEGYVFSAGPGSKTEYRHTFRKAFRRAVERADMNADAITPHVLRHTAITTMVKANIDLPTIQRVSGHKTLAMVIRYTHVDSVHVNAAVNSLSILG